MFARLRDHVAASGIAAVLVASLLASPACGQIPGGINEAVPADAGRPKPPLALSIVIPGPAEGAVVYVDQPVKVVLTNVSGGRVKFWRRDLWGPFDDSQLTWTITNQRTGTVHNVTAAPWTLRQPTPEGLSPAEKKEFAAQFVGEIGDGEQVEAGIRFLWPESPERDWQGLPEPNSSDTFTLAVEFSSAPPWKDADSDVWAGTVRSNRVAARLVSPDLNQPYEYLEHGFVDRAIELMRENPETIDRGNLHIRLPLLIATQKGLTRAVEWILDNGGDVNAYDIGRNTALHLVSDPEIARLLLAKKPNLRAGNKTPLETIADRSCSASPNDRLEDLRTIARMFIDAGAEYDLATAIKLDDMRRVRHILIADEALAERMSNGESPLRLAARLGRTEICRTLVEEFRIDVDDTKGWHAHVPILYHALPYPVIAKLLIEHDANIFERVMISGGAGFRWGFDIGWNATILHHAARLSNAEIVTLLLDKELNPFVVAESQLFDADLDITALDIAAIYWRADNVRAILDHPRFQRADPGRRQALINKCLLEAAGTIFPENASEQDHYETLQVLLEHGADPNYQVGDRTALKIALAHNGNNIWDIHHFQVIPHPARFSQLLLDHGARLDLYSAMLLDDEDAVQRILADDSEAANTPSAVGIPALHVAIAGHRQAMVKLLLPAANLSKRSPVGFPNAEPGDMALHVAAWSNNTEAAELLFAAGADLEAINQDGRTPLHEAVRSESLEMCRLLLQFGASISAKDDAGETPLDLARSFYPEDENPTEIMSLLREYADSQLSTQPRP